MNKMIKWALVLVAVGGAFYFGFNLKEGQSTRGVIVTTSDNPLFAGGSETTLGTTASTGKVIEVRDGENIQNAVNVANAGDTVAVYPGTYKETVYVDKDGITLSGVIVGGEWPKLDGEGVKNDAILYSGNNVTVENFHISKYKGNGVFGQAGNNFVIRNNIVDDAGVYGIFPQYGKNGIISGNVLSNIADAAIYVGMSDNIDVIANEVFDSVAGIEIENTRHALVEGNYVHDNTGGILVFIMPGLPLKTTYDVIIRRNFIVNNNHPNFGAPGSAVAGIPAGSGIVIVASDDVVIEDNIITGNNSYGIGTTDFGFFKSNDKDVEPNPDRLVILNNVMSNNGEDAAPLIKSLMALQMTSKGPDIADSGAGVDKCILNPGQYRTVGLSNYYTCDFASSTSYATRTMTLSEPAPAFKLEGASAEDFERELGRHTYYGICSGCHLDDDVLIGPSVAEIQDQYLGDLEGMSTADVREEVDYAAKAISDYIANPVRVREHLPPMPTQNYLSEQTRVAAAKFMLSRNKKLPMLRKEK